MEDMSDEASFGVDPTTRETFLQCPLCRDRIPKNGWCRRCGRAWNVPLPQPERRKQFLMSMTGTRAEIVAMLKRVLVEVQCNGVGLSWKSIDRGEGAFKVLDTAREPIDVNAIVQAELDGVLARYDERGPDPWEEAMRGEGDGVGF